MMYVRRKMVAAIAKPSGGHAKPKDKMMKKWSSSVPRTLTGSNSLPPGPSSMSLGHSSAGKELRRKRGTLFLGIVVSTENTMIEATTANTYEYMKTGT